MKLCSIVPVEYSGVLQYKSDIVMLLAHLSMEHPGYVAEAVIHDKYKIMDNSIIELGSSMSMCNLIKQAQKCLADEIILPDVFEDGEATVRLVKDNILWLRSNRYLHDFKFMAVCHGKNEEEFKKTFEELNAIDDVDVIGIPKIVCKWAGSRSKLAKIFLQTNKEIHLLGCYDSFKELSTFTQDELMSIRSIDTCLPALLSNKGNNAYASRKGDTLDLDKGTVDVDNYNDIIDQLANDFGL